MIKNKLSDISFPVQNELIEFNAHFRGSLKSNINLLDLIIKYLLKQKGKKIRPLLVLLSAKASGTINERSYRGAALVELLHTATLIHDDVVDNSDTRRGFPSINAVWKNKIAVLLGDYLLSQGLMLSVEGNDFDFLKVTTKAVRRMSEGELLQINKTRKLNIDEKTYFRIISDKTASLLSTCCEIGALSATDNPEFHSALKYYGESMGIAFQIRDDILDFVGKKNIIGKPLGGDIKEKKLTLPLIFALNNASEAEANKIKKLIKSANKKNDVKEVIDFVKSKGGIEYAKDIAENYSFKAKEHISILPESPSKQSLLDLVDFINSRNN